MKEQETTVTVEAANGMLVHVPVSQLDEWKKGQEEIKEYLDRGEEPPLSPEDQAIRDEIMKDIFGDNFERK